MKKIGYPLIRCASLPSLAFGGKGVATMARQSRFHGAPASGCFMAFGSRFDVVDD